MRNVPCLVSFSFVLLLTACSNSTVESLVSANRLGSPESASKVETGRKNSEAFLQEAQSLTRSEEQKQFMQKALTGKKSDGIYGKSEHERAGSSVPQALVEVPEANQADMELSDGVFVDRVIHGLMQTSGKFELMPVNDRMTCEVEERSYRFKALPAFLERLRSERIVNVPLILTSAGEILRLTGLAVGPSEKHTVSYDLNGCESGDRVNPISHLTSDDLEMRPGDSVWLVFQPVKKEKVPAGVFNDYWHQSAIHPGDNPYLMAALDAAFSRYRVSFHQEEKANVADFVRKFQIADCKFFAMAQEQNHDAWKMEAVRKGDIKGDEAAKARVRIATGSIHPRDRKTVDLTHINHAWRVNLYGSRLGTLSSKDQTPSANGLFELLFDESTLNWLKNKLAGQEDFDQFGIGSKVGGKIESSLLETVPETQFEKINYPEMVEAKKKAFKEILATVFPSNRFDPYSNPRSTNCNILCYRDRTTGELYAPQNDAILHYGRKGSFVFPALKHQLDIWSAFSDTESVIVRAQNDRKAIEVPWHGMNWTPVTDFTNLAGKITGIKGKNHRLEMETVRFEDKPQLFLAYSKAFPYKTQAAMHERVAKGEYPHHWEVTPDGRFNILDHVRPPHRPEWIFENAEHVHGEPTLAQRIDFWASQGYRFESVTTVEIDTLYYVR